MRKIAAGLALCLAACAGPESGKPSSSGEPRMSETDFETKVASSIAFDPSLVRAGERVVYFVKRAGENSVPYAWAAVAEEGSAVWIENKVPFEPRSMIVKSKLDRTGRLLEQWVGEAGGVPGQTYPNPRRSQDPLPPSRDVSGAKGDTKEQADTIVVGGRPYACTKVTTTLAYPDGRKSVMTNWFSKEVPFAPSKALGGLVKRQFGRLTMELVTFDPQGAKSELQIPK